MDYDELPCRDNDIYKGIEDFKLYELTTCITYEMAIRNELIDEKIKKLDLLIRFEDEHKYLQLKLPSDSNFSTSQNRWKSLEKLCNLHSNIFKRELYQMIDLERSKAFDNLQFEKFIDKMEIPFNESKLIRKVYTDKKHWEYDQKTKINTIDLDHMIKFLEEDLIYNHYIYPKSSVYQIPGSSENYYFDHDEKSHINIMDLKNINEHNADFFYSIQHDGSNNLNLIIDNKIKEENTKIYPKFEINTIVPVFKRIMYEPRTSLVALNFSKPLEENLLYIKSIYKHLDNSGGKIIKTHLEYIGEDLNIETIDFKNMSALEWADCFFIYDFYNSSHSDSDATLCGKLKEIFNDYRGIKIEKSKEQKRKDKNKGDNSKYKVVQLEIYQKLKLSVYAGKQSKAFYSDTTIRERYKLMKALIQEEKYKFLLLK